MADISKIKLPNGTTYDLKDAVARKKIPGSTIAPIYVGDCLDDIDHYPNSVIRVDDYFYLLSAATRTAATAASSNAGIVRKFDISTNTCAATLTRDIGHGNSVAYNSSNNTIYVAPIWNYASGTEVGASYLYKFNKNFAANGTETIPVPAQAVSYDPVTNILYFASLQNNNTLWKIYKKTGNSWSEYTSVDLSNVLENDFGIFDRSYNQDLAVYNNRFYISSPYGNIVYGELKANTSVVEGSFATTQFDSQNRFRIGELEGFEFTSEGRLYAAGYVFLNTYENGLLDSFVLELPVGICPPHSSSIYGNPFSLAGQTANLNSETIERFALSTTSIRSLQQLVAMPNGSDIFTNVLITGNVTEPNCQLRVEKNISLEIQGTYTVNAIEVAIGELNVHVSSSSGKIKFTNASYGFYLLRAAALSFTGQYALNVEAPTSANPFNLVASNYYFSRVVTRLSPVGNVPLRIAGAAIKDYWIYYGSTEFKNQKINSIELNAGTDTNPRTVSAADLKAAVNKWTEDLYFAPGKYTIGIWCYGFVTTNGTVANIVFPFSKSFNNVSSVTINTISGSIRYNGGYLISLNANLLSYVTSATLNKDQNVLEIALTKSDKWGSANNVPIAGVATIKFTLA